MTVGCTSTRLSTVINGTSPGPVLRFKVGERVLLNVTNAMATEDVTIHWHGLSMSASPWSDGTPKISQWPIKAGEWFQYEYFLGPEDQGTCFYHSHVGLQQSTAHGALIIEPATQCETKVDYEDVPLVIADSWYKTDSVLQHGLLNAPWTWVNTTNHILINGQANDTCAGFHCGQKFPVIDVRPDTNYKFRFIHAGGLVYVSLGFQDHSFDIVEVGGTNLKPYGVDHIEFGPGERYSVMLKTKSTAEVKKDGRNGLYLIKMASRWRQPPVTNYAVLRYKTDDCDESDVNGYIDMTGNDMFYSSMDAYVLPPESFGWLASQFEALVDEPPPKNTKNEVILLNTQQYKQDGLVKWKVNDVSFNELDPSGTGKPYLVQLYQGHIPMPKFQSQATNFFDAASNAYVLKDGQVVDIVIINQPSAIKHNVEIHPWHFHSRHFWVMAIGKGNFNEQSYEKYKLAHPYRKDSQMVYPGTESGEEVLADGESGDFVVIRYHVSGYNSGAFPIHCHASPHLLSGMGAVFVISPDTLPDLIAGYKPFLEYGGEAYGSSDWTPIEPSYYLDGYGSIQQRKASLARHKSGHNLCA